MTPPMPQMSASMVRQEAGVGLHRRPFLLLPRRALTAAFLLALAAGAGFRFWSLSSRPGWQYDEGVYTGVAANLLQHGTINENITYGAAWSPDLYQPPFYFIVLARWFALTGVSIYHARILGVLCAVATLTLLWRLLIRAHGPRIALYAMVPIALDGWLMYVQRISYLENMLLLLVVAGLLLYQRALDTPSWRRFILAGIVLGFAAAFKYTGVYVIGAVLLCWLITHRAHRKHLALLGCALASFSTAILSEVITFDTGGHDWWWQDTLVQVRRVLGIKQSGGTLTSPAAALHLLLAEYDVFVPSFLIALVTLVLALRRLWTCYRQRNWRPVSGNVLLWSWMASALVIFGFSSLRYPQYFALILVPMYAWFWTEAGHWRLRTGGRTVLAAAACLAGIASFGGRVVGYNDNVFADAQQYAATSIPPQAVVIADESIGDLIKQPYCREQQSAPCADVASYLITWNTYLQTTWDLGDPAYRKAVVGAVPLRSWTGFNGTVTVWRIRR
jgi:4-amino-4-deoxy-L-arabinose transferase-like glycosyltransferase